MGCGLMQKWNKIQHDLAKDYELESCGLMQKWNKIQLKGECLEAYPVVV